MVMLQANNVTKKFSKRVVAVNQVSMDFLDNTFYGIMGRSGSGKSTLLQMLGTLTAPTSGSIRLDGREISALKPRQLADLRMRKIGFVFQGFHLHPCLTAVENVMLPMQINPAIPPAKRRARAEQLLRRVEMQDRMKHYPKELSGGEQQRVAIARALANDPSCILADEPTGNLDSQTERRIFALLRELSADKTVITVTHNELISRYADRMLTMQDGVLSAG